MRWRFFKTWLMIWICISAVYAPGAGAAPLDQGQIDAYVADMMDQDSLPGVAVSIMNKGETYIQGYGVASQDAGSAVTPDTLFELGSNSKAYTAVGLLLLAEQGKVDLKAPISRYLSGTQWKFNSEQAEPTVEDFLYQTSGMGSNSVALIRPSAEESALKDTVQVLASQPLWYRPGTQFLYSTGNYDVLGAIIEQVSGDSYESFMTEEVFAPLGLSDTYAGQNASLPAEQLSAGYKLGLWGNQVYDAPIYRGNTPAGYILSSARDMAQWLNIQLNSSEGDPEPLRRAIMMSHLGDERVDNTRTAPYDSPFRYGGGWLVFNQGDEARWSHGGNNPNFSSYVIFDQKQEIGIAVMGNRNTTFTYAIADGIYQILQGNPVETVSQDTAATANLAATIMLMITILLVAWMGYRVIRLRKEIRQGWRTKVARSLNVYIRMSLWICLAALLLGIAWYVPKLLFWGYPWSFILVWAPFSIAPAMVGVAVSTVLFAVLRIAATLHPRSNVSRSSKLTIKSDI